MIKTVIWYSKDKYIEAKIVEFKNIIDIINLNFVIKLMQGNASVVSDAIGIEADFMFYALGIEASFCASQWYTKEGEKIRAGRGVGGSNFMHLAWMMVARLELEYIWTIL